MTALRTLPRTARTSMPRPAEKEDRTLGSCLIVTILALVYSIGSAVGLASCEERQIDVAVPVLVYGGSNLADYLSTRAALARGGREGNPVVGRVGLTGAKLAGSAALVGLDVLAQRKAPKAVWPLRIMAIGLYGYVAIHNHGRAR